MDGQPDVSEGYRRASPWPLFVALGLALSEVGVVLNVVALSVGGLLLFVGSVAGIVHEAGYVDRPWGLLGGLGVVLVVLGCALVVGQAPTLTPERLWRLIAASATPEGNAMVIRGLSIGLAGLVAAVVSLAAAMFEGPGTGPGADFH
jgi:hypothetical protein